MGVLTFLSFDLLVERADAGYRVRVLNSPVGQAASHAFPRPFTSDELDNLFAQFGRISQDAPRESSAATTLARSFGKRLFDAIFAGEIKSAFVSSVQIAAKDGVGLRIRLRLNDAPDLAEVPWELLHDGQDFLALSNQRALVRYLELPQAIKPLPVKPPLRALVLLSNPSDYPKLDIAQEWRQLNGALADVASTGLFEIESLERATVADLQQRLRKNAYHILHFSGHGEFDASGSGDAQGALVFQDESGAGQRVDALSFARLLRDHSTLRLVVLNACEGARGETRNVFAGVAQTLMGQGIPAVIAMQFPFTDNAAQIFASTLYGALTDRFPLDAALGETRKALANQAQGLEWATPVLFTRADDGNVFELEAFDETKLREMNRAGLVRVATDALAQQNFGRAIDYAQTLLRLDPSDSTARQVLERAQMETELAQLYAEAKKLYAAEQWQNALDYLRRIQNRRLRYRDVDALVAIAERNVANRPAAPETPKPISKNDPLESHYTAVIKAFLNGRLVPFLGVGVNLIGRPQDAKWSQGQYAPTSQELAAYLAESYHYPDDDADNVVGVSQYIAVMNPQETLKGELHTVFDADYPATRLHRFLATAGQTLREKGYKLRCPVIVSTTYDDILERTFHAANEPFDLVTYIADGAERGKWWHHTFEGQDILIDTPNKYAGLQPDQRSVIVKIHGMVNRDDADHESYVITEDHYIDYLTSSDSASLLPIKIKERLSLSSFLFMGYTPRDWNLRVLLYRIWENANVRNLSWAIQPPQQYLEREIWQRRGVSVIEASLEDYLDAIETRVREYPRFGSNR